MKLRRSCNNCYAKKIKCEFLDLNCVHCLKNNLVCEFTSESRGDILKKHPKVSKTKSDGIISWNSFSTLAGDHSSAGSSTSVLSGDTLDYLMRSYNDCLQFNSFSDTKDSQELHAQSYSELSSFLVSPSQSQYDKSFLVGYYLEHVQELLPILHPPTIRKLNCDNDNLLVTAICSWSLYYLSKQQNSFNPFQLSNDFLQSARDWIAQGCTPSLENLQALLLLISYYTASGNVEYSVLLQGISVKMAYMIEANVEPPLRFQSQTSTRLEVETSRRCFWRCFINDSLTQVGTHSPRLISEQDVAIKLPMAYSDWISLDSLEPEMTLESEDLSAFLDPKELYVPSFENVGGFGHYIILVKIHSRVCDYLKTSASPLSHHQMILESALRDWHQALPPIVRDSSNHSYLPNSSVGYLEALVLYYSIHIKLNINPLVQSLKVNFWDSHGLETLLNALRNLSTLSVSFSSQPPCVSFSSPQSYVSFLEAGLVALMIVKSQCLPFAIRESADSFYRVLSNALGSIQFGNRVAEAVLIILKKSETEEQVPMDSIVGWDLNRVMATAKA